MSSEPAVVVEDVAKVYRSYATASHRLLQALRRQPPADAREHWALRGVSFEVHAGETLGIVGRNGCGKSTLLEIVAGVLRPTRGTVRVRGRIAALLELGAGLDPELTGYENIAVYGSLLGMARAEIDERLESIVAFSELGEAVADPVKTYSSGMFLRLAFSVAINTTPDVLIVDEALAVGDEAFQRRCFARIEQLRESGVTILFVSHAASTVLQVCDRALLLDHGESLMLAAPKEVIAHYHRLLHAPPERQPEIRAEILRGAEQAAPAAAPTALGADDVAASEVRSLEDDRFDAEFQPKSTLAYEPRGALIGDVHLRNEHGERVNVLRRGATYSYHFDVEFLEDCFAVRYGMMIKDVIGTDLGGLATLAPGQGEERMPAGSAVHVQIPLVMRLAPGTYFGNAGVVGSLDGEEVFLHRILDVLIFRVAVEADCLVTGAIDLSADAPAQVTARGDQSIRVIDVIPREGRR